jgi:hypothetical protein
LPTLDVMHLVLKYSQYPHAIKLLLFKHRR